MSSMRFRSREVCSGRRLTEVHVARTAPWERTGAVRLSLDSILLDETIDLQEKSLSEGPHARSAPGGRDTGLDGGGDHGGSSGVKLPPHTVMTLTDDSRAAGQRST